MQKATQDIIRSTFEDSNEGRIHFGQVIGQLMSAKVESYHVDYRSGRATNYLPEGETVDLEFETPKEGIGDTFDGDAVRAAILGAQQGKVMYPEFKLLSQRAGCTGYTVWITGQHVTYFGRKGETHIERFPS